MYSYLEIGNDYTAIESGFNLTGLFGLEAGIIEYDNDTYDLTASISAGPISVGINGIGLSFGITLNNTTLTIGTSVGWGTLALVIVLAVSPVPLLRLAAVLFFAWIF